MKLSVLVSLLAVALAPGCSSGADPVDVVADVQTEAGRAAGDHRPEGWTEATHSKGADPDYDIVFPQGEVLQISITISPEDWQAMLDDMTGLYGEFGKSGEQQQNVPPEAVEACEEFAIGDDCTITLPDKEVTGTCQKLWDGLVACKGDGQGNADPTGAEACVGKSAEEACEFAGGPGGLPGLCLQAEQLVCIPELAIEECDGLVAGDDCSVGPPNNPKAGICADFTGVVACVPVQQIAGEEPPPGGPPGGMEGDVNPIWVPVTVEANGLSWWHVGMRFKGNSTLKFTWQQGSYKLPFKLDLDQFEDDHPEVDDQRFYGFKRLAFGNNQRDDTFLCDKLAGDFFSASGVPTPARAFAAIHVDVGEGSRYMGLYTLAEVPDKPLFRNYFGDDEGNLYKPNGNGARWTLGPTLDESSFSKKSNEEEEDWSDVEAAIAALHADSTDAESWRGELETRFNADVFLRYLAVNTVIQDWDQYGNIPHNYYVYGDPLAGGQLCWIPWDHNGSLKSQGGIMAPLPLDMEGVKEDWPLIRYLMDDPVYLQSYRTYVAEFASGPFASEAAHARVAQAHDLIAPYVVGEQGENEPYTVLTSESAFDTATQALQDHIDSRHKAVADYLN